MGERISRVVNMMEGADFERDPGRKIEQAPKPEESKAVIRLRIYRHDEKGVAQADDRETLLTPAGRLHAKDAAREIDLDQAVAWGSPRKRAQETAGFVMAGKRAEITGEESLEELKKKVNSGLPSEYGSKIMVDKRLDYAVADSVYGKAFMDAFKKGEVLRFFIDTSDALAAETGDTASTTYGRAAADIAGIMKKYVDVFPRWEKLQADEQKKYTDTLWRELGSHQTVPESFLLKVVEKTRGASERDKLVQALDGKGFGYSEGYDVEIRKRNGVIGAHIVFEKKDKDGKVLFAFDEEVPTSIIEAILAERNL